MKKHFHQIIAIAFIAVFAAGCASAPSRFYALNSTAKGDGTSAANYAVAVGPVTVPAEVDRPQFTVQVAPNRVAVDEFNRWAAPLNENIARVIAGDLSSLLGTPRVAAVSLANFDPAYRVTIDIQQFASVPGKFAQIKAVWVVRKSAGGITLSGRTVASEPVLGENFDALVAAHSRALAKVSSDIAAAIRSEAEQ
ncbi:MAG: PqiC family protein [Verrucomicrobiales bacterium]|nr:PqiC family protein [Verrucomicrobiales bacterium]